ncbi:hypothetical protein ACFL5O_12110 [Myxococcota bacterium]
MGPVGRETLAAISSELESSDSDGMGFPEVEFAEGPVGRDTSAVITGELVAKRLPSQRPVTKTQSDSVRARSNSQPSRVRTKTLGYEERESRSPGGPSQVSAKGGTPRSRGGTTPPSRPQTTRTTEKSPGGPEHGRPFDIFEMVTFVVRGDLARLGSEAARREFVVHRLLHRLPVSTSEDVDRVDVTPWTVHGTVIVRVWCRVSST